MRVHTYNPNIQEMRQEDHEFKDILNYIVKPMRKESAERENQRERQREETANIPTVHSSVIPWLCLKTGTQYWRTGAKADEK